MPLPEVLVQYDRPSFDGVAKVQGTVIDLTGKTLSFEFQGPDGVDKSRPCTILSATAGTFRLTFAANDLDSAGAHSGRFKIVDATGKPFHSRKRYYFRVEHK